MSSNTSIEWTDRTWNPVRGCSLVSAGCANCYAMKTAHRFNQPGGAYDGLTEMGPNRPRWNGTIMTLPSELETPLHWKKPRRVFVNSMSDLFHEDVPDEFLDQAFAVMAIAKQHTYQILTKRPERMRDYFIGLAEKPSRRLYESVRGMFRYKGFTGQLGPEDTIPTRISVPFSNIWLGVSIEDQATADERIPILLQTPAAVRFVSAEPLLGPVHFNPWWLTRSVIDVTALTYGGQVRKPNPNPSLDWVIVGGESGPGARPCDVEWIRSIKRECQAAAVPCFVKQIGANPLPFAGAKIKFYAPDQVGVDLTDKKGGDMAEWPEDLRIREFPR